MMTDTELDFDSWTPEQEEAAIRALAVENDVKTIIVERRFIGRFPDGEVLELPLRLSLNQVAALEAESDDPIDQVRSLFASLGGDTERLLRQDISAVTRFAEKFFATFNRIAGVSLGE